MLQIGMIVKILPDAEYSGKFTGYIGKVKNYFSQNKKVGVELFQQTNDASSKGLFWFSESKVVAAGSLPDAMMEYTSLTRRLYARQLCGLYNPARYEAFRDLVNSTEDRLIVFYNFTEEMERLKGIAKGLNRPVSVLSGEEKNLDAYRYQHNGTLYKCVQAHTSQADWTPDTASSLWSKTSDPAEEWPEWSQPVGAHDAYSKGAKVSHKEKHWISTVDSNVWEPGVYGWEESTDGV